MIARRVSVFQLQNPHTVIVYYTTLELSILCAFIFDLSTVIVCVLITKSSYSHLSKCITHYGKMIHFLCF